MRNLVIEWIMDLDDFYSEKLLNTYSNKDLLDLLSDLLADYYDGR